MATVTLQRMRHGGITQARSLFGSATGALYVSDFVGRVTVDVSDAGSLLAEGYVTYVPGAGGGTTPTSGVAVLDFGSFPGSPSATATVVAGAAADPNAVIDAWVTPQATADHSADEHAGDPPMVVAAVVSGGNIVISGYPSGRDLAVPPGTPFGRATTSQMPIGRQQVMPYGKWSIAWAFSP